MEHISEFLRQTRINISNKDTDTWSNAEEAPSPSANCPVCKGAGVVHPFLPSGKPDFSQVVPCRCVKKELDDERLARLKRYSNLGMLAQFTFQNLEPQGRSGNPKNQAQFQKAYEAVKAFAADPNGWLVLVGPSGSGKTHLTAALANERISHGFPAFYIATPDLLDHLRATFSPNSEIPYDEFFDQVRNAPLLILDDFGLQASTAWAREKLDQLLTYRFNRRLPTVIVPIVALEQLDDRLQTRLTDPELSKVCVTEEKKTTSLEYSWGPEFQLQKSMTFKNFDLQRPNLSPEQLENLEMAYRAALNFAQSPDGWLVLQGENGCGKTHLAAAIVNYQFQAEKPALFIVVPEFLDHLRSTFNPDKKDLSYDELFEKVKTAPLLVLDDFGEQSATPWAREKLYQIMNYRYNASLPTVITTVYTLDEVEIESRIASRLIDGRRSNFLNIIAPDYRSDALSHKRTSRRERRGR
jgi:DNA replication protein DnaC